MRGTSKLFTSDRGITSIFGSLGFGCGFFSFVGDLGCLSFNVIFGSPSFPLWPLVLPGLVSVAGFRPGFARWTPFPDFGFGFGFRDTGGGEGDERFEGEDDGGGEGEERISGGGEREEESEDAAVDGMAALVEETVTRLSLSRRARSQFIGHQMTRIIKLRAVIALSLEYIHLFVQLSRWRVSSCL
jgi:hypothetical protein